MNRKKEEILIDADNVVRMHRERMNLTGIEKIAAFGRQAGECIMETAARNLVPHWMIRNAWSRARQKAARLKYLPEY